ncbi:reticulon-3 isoform X1 [Artibeus jamaicensis]|uniref:reticulon-3 isoform X1 n=1 Tax=Artibeus jamaicensis TaxID=9417 RepID=UPI00235B0788|nr:reticulon-3 isoform X1 [Artibeus jamaicensis]
MSSLCSGEPASEILTSSSLSSSEVRKTDLATLRGEQSHVLGSHSVLAKEGQDCLARLDVTKVQEPQGTSKDGANCPVPVGEGGCCHHPSIPASVPGHPAFLSEDAVQVEDQRNEDQGSRNPSETPSGNDKTVLDANDKFTLPTAQKPATEQSRAGGTGTYSLSPSKVSGGSGIEKDSPESPFEVIIDRAAFDKEYKDAYKESANYLGSWAVHTDRESSADISESNDKVFPLRNKEAGRFPTSALLTRQFSHTTAALEEVSRCVSDMHNFTNEVLTWDFVPHVKQQNEKADYITKTTGLDTSKYNSEIPVVNLKTNTHQKIPVCSINGSTPVAKLTGHWAEASLPQENAAIEKPIPDYLDSTPDASVKGVQGNVQKQGDTLSEVPGSPLEKCVSPGSGTATVKVVLPDGHLKGEMNWQSSMLGEVTEADSSGESDDTVIEDITASISFESNKIQAKKPVSSPSAVVKADEKEIKEILNYNRETKTSENFEGSVSDSEPQIKPDILARSPAGMAAGSQAPDTNVMSGHVKQSDGVSAGIPEKAATTEGPGLPSAALSHVPETDFSPNVIASAHLESLHERSIKDVDDSSPEDLITAFTETGGKGIVDKSEGNAFEAISEKAADFQTALPVDILYERGPGGSDIKDIKSEYSQQNRGIRGSELLDAFPTQGASVASLDLEQERLTIRALKELSERQTEKSAPARGEVDSPSEETLKQTFTFAPQSSQPQRSRDVQEHADVKGPDLAVFRKPTITKEATSVDVVSSLSETELVNRRVLAGLLADSTGNRSHCTLGGGRFLSVVAWFGFLTQTFPKAVSHLLKLILS